MPKSKRDLADLLRSVMAIEAVSGRRSSVSSDDIEKGLGMVKQAKDTGSRRISSRRIAQARRGDHALGPKIYQKVLELAPHAWPECSPIIWELVRSGRLHSQNADEYYSTISKQIHSLLHLRTTAFGLQRLGWIFNPVTFDHLRCLVALGTLDAVTALWKLLIEADDEGSDKVLAIASYIPPALATFYRRPEGRRTAILLFARMRQLILDRVQWGGRELSLCDYDLRAVADRAFSWALPPMEIPHGSELRRKTQDRSLLSPAEVEKTEQLVQAALRSRYLRRDMAVGKAVTLAGPTGEVRPVRVGRRGLPDIPSEVAEWIERERAPLRQVGNRSPKSAKWADPAPWPIDVINLPHPSGTKWGKYAIAQFKGALGDYFCADAL